MFNYFSGGILPAAMAEAVSLEDLRFLMSPAQRGFLGALPSTSTSLYSVKKPSGEILHFHVHYMA